MLALRLCVAVIGACAVAIGASIAVAADPFYKGKRLSVVEPSLVKTDAVIPLYYDGNYDGVTFSVPKVFAKPKR